MECTKYFEINFFSSLLPIQNKLSTEMTVHWSFSVTCDRSVVFSGYSTLPRHAITEIMLKVALSTIN